MSLLAKVESKSYRMAQIGFLFIFIPIEYYAQMPFLSIDPLLGVFLFLKGHYNNLMQWYEILLVILAILFTIYIAGFALAWHQISYFNRRLKDTLVAIKTLLSEKRDVLLSLYALYEEQGLIEDDSKRDLATKVRWLEISSKDNEQTEAESAILEDLKRYLMVIGTRKSVSGRESASLRENLRDLDSNYRKALARYAYDVKGYAQSFFSWS